MIKRRKTRVVKIGNRKIGGNNPIREYYDSLISKGVAAHNARNAVARYIARISYGILKSGEKYQPYRWRHPDIR